MNKTDLIKSVAHRTGTTEVATREMVEAVLDTIKEELNDGNGITLQGFGSLSPWYQVARTGRNPRTGTTCEIMPRKSVKFKAGKLLLKQLNS